MNNQTIVLHSKDRDIELLKEVRIALVAKGFNDSSAWNDVVHNWTVIDSIYIHGNLISYQAAAPFDRMRIPVSRNDFQTMFLLY